MNAEKIIFADVDGMFNRLYKIGSPDFEPRCVAAFNRIITTTGAKIVLSSSWRYKIHQGHCSPAEMQVILASNGIVGDLVGITRPDEGDEPRWMQIRDWLQANIGSWSKYCILDDDPDAFGGRPGVLTSGRTGLTEANADLAIAILGRVNEPDCVTRGGK